MRPDLIKFAERILSDWPDYGLTLDGCELQDLAVECGLLRPETMQGPCVDPEQSDACCHCAEMGADFPTTCYRRVPLR